MTRRRVLLIGIEGATPAIVSQLLDRGAMPHLRGIVENGCMGALTAQSPLVRAMAWTTLATGRNAPAHGVCGDVALRADGAGIEPAAHSAWRAPAFWELLTAAGYACATIGWPASAPATSWDAGLVIDESYAIAFGPGFDAWSLLPDCVVPVSWRDDLRELRVHPGDISGEEIAALVPKAALVDQDEDPRLTHIAVALARASTVHAAATHVATKYEWDFLAVVYPLVSTMEREFLRFREPRLADVDNRDVEVYGSAVDTAYALQDAMLGTLLRIAGEDTTVVVVAPYGLAAGADRPDAATAARLPPAVAWNRRHGFFAARGAGIPADRLLHGARVRDIAPTVLDLFGLRCAAHDGRPIAGVSGSTAEKRSIDVAPQTETTTMAAISEGELAGLDAQQRRVVDDAINGWFANAAEAHLAIGEFSHAKEAYARVLARNPGDWMAKARLARCHLHLGELEQCRTLAEEIVLAKPDVPWGYLLGAAGLVFGGTPEKADALIASALETGRGVPGVAVRLGVLDLLRHDWKDAEARFREAIAASPRSVEAHDGLGSALLAQERYTEAVEALRTAIGLVYHYPLAHVHLAMALERLGRLDEAVEAAQVALSQDPLAFGAEDLIARATGGGKG